MRWYAAHLIQYFKHRKGKQKSYCVWENIVLVRAANFEEARAKAEQIGKQEEAYDDKSLTIGGHPAKLVFAGVRKVVECVDPESRPGEGTEVSYTEMELPSETAIRKLVGGEPVSVLMEDLTPEDLEEAGSQPERQAV
jgi:hypothetical protein